MLPSSSSFSFSFSLVGSCLLLLLPSPLPLVNFFFSISSLFMASWTVILTLGVTFTQANVRSWVTHPPRRSQARIWKYDSLWSLLGIRLAYGLGGPLSAESIFGRLGIVGNVAAYAVVAIESLLMSAFGETMYVSRWLSGGTARARRQ